MSATNTTTTTPAPTSPLQLQTGLEIVAFDSSSQEKQYRVESPDGRHFQINERFYHLLDLLRTPTTTVDLAVSFHQRTGQQIPLDQLSALCTQLIEKGLVTVDGQPTQSTAPAASSTYLGMHFRRTILSAERLAPLAGLFSGFFRWSVAAPTIALIVIAHVFAYRELSMQPELNMAQFAGPLLAFCMLFSIALHELGHVAACQRWNCPHGSLGFGLYFSMPIFYVDVTQAWRLTRRQRAAVDIGGVYIQMLCVPLALLLYWWTGNLTFLMLIMAIDVVVIYNFEPWMKMDGYWLLSDLTGVPNLHNRTRAATLQIARQLWQKITLQKPAPQPSPFAQWPQWVRRVIWGYLALSIVIWPLFMIAWLPAMWQAMISYPALVQTATVDMLMALSQGNLIGAFNQLGALFMPTLIVIGLGFELKRLSGPLFAKFINRRPRFNPNQPAAVAS
ncbi:MAG: hypothetical protein R2911_27930 [Caldilineaceae bacterium]